MNKTFRFALIPIGLCVIWQAVVSFSSVPSYILPGPIMVLFALKDNAELILEHSFITFFEIIMGMLLGTILGCLSAMLLIWFKPLRQWLMPALVISQAIPVFALAPILVLWLGYGLASKVAMATLIIYFPVTSAFYDGLQQTAKDWLDIAKVMGGKKVAILYHIQIPAALPKLATGMRVAAAVAPIGAIVGEWVGSSKGLGFLMLHANARMQVDLMFAALFVIAVFAVLFYYVIDKSLARLTRWHHPHKV
ncbi:ABC transporter permease [Curvivirga aplysinae]|uniref:ABC transporter permease n=1 Tax=Curvivirga aplysinae TaxID=2529852 RepID=UPI0012BD7B6E|nr:ABC transporter permease [Curvivirga aplysinae]MTI09495.1 ABC transporter permease [Curvivirga aplysinae]